MTRWLLLALVLFSSAARGEEVALVHDEWVACWSGAVKVEWAHRRIEERTAAPPGEVRFVLTITTTTVVDGDQRLVTEYRVDTDERARVRTAVHTERSPWGTSTESIATVGSALVWRWQVRELPVMEGTIQDETHEARILALLVQRGAEPPGARDVMVLSSHPSPGVRPLRLDVASEPDGTWRITRNQWTERRTSDGRLLAGEGGSRREVATTAEQAAALDEPPPAPLGPSPPAFVELPGARVRAPGSEWELVTPAAGEGAELGRILAAHPSRAVGSVTIEIGGLLGETPDDRLTFGRAYQERTNTEGAGRLELGAPELVVSRGRPGIHFACRGRMRSGIEVAGDWYLIDLGAARAIVFLLQPIDLRASRAADLERLALAIDFAPVELAWKRIREAGASVEVPTQWTERSPGQFVSPTGSYLRIQRGLLGGLTLEERQARTPRDDQRVELEIERREETRIDSRAAFVTVFRVTAWPGGFPMRSRLVCCGTAYEDGTCTEVFLFVPDNEFDEVAVRRVLDGLRWVQEH